MKVKGRNYRAVWMDGSEIVVVNQPLLPHRFELARLRDHVETANAIRKMVVRGAGTIGATAAFGLAQACLEARKREASKPQRGRASSFASYMRRAYAKLLQTRPTAVDLEHALHRVALRVEDALGDALLPRDEAPTPSLPPVPVSAKGRPGCPGSAGPLEAACRAAMAEAQLIADEYAERGRKIGEVGQELIQNGARVLTHCNAGWLALVDWGSAPAPVYLAHRQGRNVFVWVDETRPRNQGANLTSWEFLQEGVPHRIIADNAAGLLMRRGDVDLCIVGADRIAANGDVANKIGTYEKAVLARENGVPFYVAAPTSTIDLSCETGDDIPIEEREEAELHYVYGMSSKNKLLRVRVSPRKAWALNPSFDVTPARYITGIITEQGIKRPGAVRKLFQASRQPTALSGSQNP